MFEKRLIGTIELIFEARELPEKIKAKVHDALVLGVYSLEAGRLVSKEEILFEEALLKYHNERA